MDDGASHVTIALSTFVNSERERLHFLAPCSSQHPPAVLTPTPAMFSPDLPASTPLSDVPSLSGNSSFLGTAEEPVPVDTPIVSVAAPAHVPKRRKKQFSTLHGRSDESVWLETDEAIIASFQASIRSDVYSHFTISLSRNELLKEMSYILTCVHQDPLCPTHTKPRSKSNHGTKNYQNASSSCDKRNQRTTSTLPLRQTVLVEEKPYKQSTFNTLISLDSIDRLAPMASHGETFVDIAEYLNKLAVVPHRTTISLHIKKIYDVLSIEIRNILGRVSSALHLQMDGWTAPNKSSYAGVIVVFWNGLLLCRLVLEFIK